MSSMSGWQLANQDQPSFAKYFEQQFQPPQDRTSTQTLKIPSTVEIHASGPSLTTLESLTVEQLTLGTHDHSWATNMLSTYGPEGLPSTWSQEDFLQYEMPAEILEENNVLEYIEKIYLRKAVCAAVFLFRSSTGSPPERFPFPPTGCRIVHQSASGPSGRPDREVFHGEKRCCLLEAKTRRVCRDGDLDGDVLHRISEHLECLLLYQGADYDPTALSTASAGKRKAMTIIYQVS